MAAERNLSVRLAVIDGGKVRAELRDVGETGERSLKRIEQSARPASRALQALDGAAGEVRGSLEATAGRLGPLGAALTRLGPAGLMAGAALGGIVFGLKASLEAAAEAEASYRRLEAVLKATGDASGLTAGQIANFAEEMEAATLASAESVMDAASILATFRSVAGDTFTRALRLAQDLAAVFGQDLRGSAVQLGKALEDPVEGINALRRVGVSFTASQRDLIASLVETGQTAAAQKVILDALEQQVGGAGAAEATGLTGAANRLSDAWGNLLKEIGKTPVAAGLAEGALDVLARALDGWRRVIADDPISERIVAANRSLIEAENRLDRMRSAAGARAGATAIIAIRQQEARVAYLRSQVEGLIAEARAAAERFDQEQRRVEDGQRAAQGERRTELLAGQRKALDAAIAKLVDDPAQRIAAVNKELQETRRRLEALRAPGENDPQVDASIGRAEELARRRIAAIEKPAREAAERMAAADAKAMADLERQIVGLTDKRRAFIEQAQARLSEGANEAQRAEVERLAAALFDQKQAIEDLNAALEREQKLFDEGHRVMEANRTALESYGAEVERLDRLLAAGAIDAETYARAIARAEQDKLDASTAWRDGALRALRDYVRESENAARNAERAMTGALRAGEDAFVKWATTGKLSAADLFNTIAEEALRAAYRIALVKPLGGLFEGIFSSIGSSIAGSLFSGGTSSPAGGFPSPGPVMVAHRGGVIGHDPLPRRLVDEGSFADARRFHGGGLVGNEVPIIARRGEGVFTPEQMRALAPASGERPVVNVAVNVRNAAPGTEATADWRREGNGNLTLDIMIEQVEGRIARNVGRGEGIAPTLERRYGLNPAAGAYR
ncbi:MAG: phage tail tape measure C-terminal domain-containing protein [Alphaproteobacteria bacterium]